MADFKRNKNGERLDFRGINTIYPPDAQPSGKIPYAQNVRRYLKGKIKGRTLLTDAIETFSSPVHTIRRLNDSTPSGPSSGYALVAGAGTKLFLGSTQVASGLSGNPLSLIPFRPNTSVQPWMYVGDSSTSATVTSSNYVCNGMLKVRSDGLTYKAGIKEPQAPPVIGIQDTTTTGTDTLPATAMPWTNRGDINSNWNFSGTDTASSTNPIVVLTPVANATVTLTVTGTATVNGASVAPSASGPVTTNYPGKYLLSGGSCAVVLAAFTDDSGNIVAKSSSPSSGYIYSVGASATLTVPSGATQLHIGVDSQGGTYTANSGSFSVAWTVVTPAVATALSIVGDVTAYYFDDSPHSGAVASYIWKNPNDSGTGTSRTISTASGSATNNSLIFDSTPNTQANPVLWTQLNEDGTVAGTIDLFASALESEGYQDFNACIIGSFFVPEAGSYTFTFNYKDQIMFGIGGSATVSGGYVTGRMGQTISVVSGLDLVFVSTPNGEGTYQTSSITITFPSSGTYAFEADWDYWYHSGRTMVVEASPTPGASVATIPPISSSVRTSSAYKCKYRGSETGAVSNPGPKSTTQDIPVLANTVTCPYIDDPQADKVDYYRIDSSLSEYTYIATGPNDGLGGTINGIVYNTPITDTITDTAAASGTTMDSDDFEPFPSIDTPKSGVVNISSGTITWVSGDKFNTRWLPGTVIEIGSPSQLAYTLDRRPTSTTTMYLEAAPDGTNLDYNIAEPILANQPLAYLFGPTDNINFIFGVGDSLRPGTLYWCKGSNLDSAPDTNQMDVTDPSEPLVNGAMAAGRGVLFSTERAWIIVPNFFNAKATALGTEGSTWTLQATYIDRGLYIASCLAIDGAGNIFFRVKDGIHFSQAGGESKSITDEDIYNLFPHEGAVQKSITIGGYTIYPPDDAVPTAQRMAVSDGYLYYDYQGIDGDMHTLVYDIAATGWVFDVYEFPAVIHANEEGPKVNGVLVGCSDGTVRQLSSSGTETATSVVFMPCMDGGDTRAEKNWKDLYIEAEA